MKKPITIMVLLFAVFGGCSATQQASSTSEKKQSQEMNISKLKVSVTNPLPISRKSETIGLDWKKIMQSIPELALGNVAVLDLKSNCLLTTQVTKGEKEPQLLFQVDLAPNEKKDFYVMVSPDGMETSESSTTTYCRFVPERKDDFAWENDRVCYRMYGPALEYETITCGIDAWGKCVSYPVFDKIIKDYVEKGIPYHENHGEGGDFYKVGNTLGCGGMAPFVDDKVCLAPHNFYDWKVITNGPIRSVFELYYRPWKAGSCTVSETKRISIDLGSNFSRVECHYKTDDTEVLPLAAGIILRDTSDETFSADNTIAYWLPADFNAGYMACGVIFSNVYHTDHTEADSHLLLTLKHDVNEPVVYYAGSCWDENESLSTFEKWQAYMKNFKKCLDAPVTVKIETIE